MQLFQMKTSPHLRFETSPAPPTVLDGADIFLRSRWLGVLGFCSLLVLGGSPLKAQAEPAAQPAASETALLPESDLKELLGPIALYPDALIAMILPASTIPSDIVLGARYIEKKGDPALADQQPWDDSVRSLARYPDVLLWMNENLEWTAAVGEAFVAQPADVMNVLQKLRAVARANGNLKDTPEQKVVVEKEVIRIVPAEPEVIYVPQYDPQVVYVESYSTAPLITFGVGWAVGSWLSFDCDWWSRSIYRGNWCGWNTLPVWRGPSIGIGIGSGWGWGGWNNGWNNCWNNGWNNGWNNRWNNAGNGNWNNDWNNRGRNQGSFNDFRAQQTTINNSVNNNNVNVVNIDTASASAWRPSARSQREFSNRQRNQTGNARFVGPRQAGADRLDGADRPSDRPVNLGGTPRGGSFGRPGRDGSNNVAALPRPSRLEGSGRPDRDNAIRPVSGGSRGPGGIRPGGGSGGSDAGSPQSPLETPTGDVVTEPAVAGPVTPGDAAGRGPGRRPGSPNNDLPAADGTTRPSAPSRGERPGSGNVRPPNRQGEVPQDPSLAPVGGETPSRPAPRAPSDRERPGVSPGSVSPSTPDRPDGLSPARPQMRQRPVPSAPAPAVREPSTRPQRSVSPTSPERPGAPTQRPQTQQRPAPGQSPAVSERPAPMQNNGTPSAPERSGSQAPRSQQRPVPTQAPVTRERPEPPQRSEAPSAPGRPSAPAPAPRTQIQQRPAPTQAPAIRQPSAPPQRSEAPSAPSRPSAPTPRSQMQQRPAPAQAPAMRQPSPQQRSVAPSAPSRPSTPAPRSQMQQRPAPQQRSVASPAPSRQSAPAPRSEMQQRPAPARAPASREAPQRQAAPQRAEQPRRQQAAPTAQRPPQQPAQRPTRSRPSPETGEDGSPGR